MEPTQFGNYTLLERISHGGMAEVFRAKSFGEAGFEREVALKLLLPSMASDEEFVNMLIDEAKIAGQLNHANIAQIFDLGVTDGRYYIVQEYVNGQDLRSILKHRQERKTTLDVSTACHIALKVCEGLYYAHNKEDVSGRRLNLVHRDISPHNILISNEGEVKIIDFGIAKAEGRSTQTMAGLVKGKFAYMSPEQIRGLPVDHRSDVFATGILLHEMLTNRALFRRSSEFETLKRARAATAEPPSQFNPRVPPALDRIALKALARHVDDRYQSAREFRDALWAFAREHNAFAGREALATPDSERAQGGDSTNSSVEIELASEVSRLREITKRGSDLASPPKITRFEPEDEIEEVEEPDAEPEDTEPSDNSTVVDPKMPFGMAAVSDDLEEDTDVSEDDANYTPTDHDAQWAADVGGPLSGSSSPFAMPARDLLDTSRSRTAKAEDDETTSDRSEKSEQSTDRFGRRRPLNLDEGTSEKQPSASSRKPTVPAMAHDRKTKPVPAMAALAATNMLEDQAEIPRVKSKLEIGTARTEPVSKAELGIAPTQAVSSNEFTPPPQRADGLLYVPRASSQGLPQAKASPPAPEYQGLRAPSAVLPKPPPQMGSMGSAQPQGSQPMPHAGGVPRGGHASAPMAVPQQSSGQMPLGQHSSGQMPLGQHSSGQMPLGQHSSGQMPLGQHSSGQMQFGGMPGSGSGPLPMPHSGSGSAPYPMPQSAMPQPGSAPYAMPQQPMQDLGSGAMQMQAQRSATMQGLPNSQRLYLLMSALFLLLLAGAATITLVITD